MDKTTPEPAGMQQERGGERGRGPERSAPRAARPPRDRAGAGSERTSAQDSLEPSATDARLTAVPPLRSGDSKVPQFM